MNLLSRQKESMDQYSEYYNTSKNIHRNMGNTQVEHRNALQTPIAPRNVTVDARLFGPTNLQFSKINLKSLDMNEDILATQDDETLGYKLDGPLNLSENDSLDGEDAEDGSKNIVDEEAIKIKWNSFIKMKKKSYLEDYVIIKEVGRGGFGRVYKVQAKYTGVIRAAKKIKKSNLAKSEHEKLFAEMAIMITLDHPCIARLFQVYDYKSSYVLILQLCEGGELFKKILSQSISEAFAAGAMTKILHSLLYIHAKGIIHRDLKPENILFEDNSKNSNLKLIDFGIAVKRQNKNKLSTRIGTPYYIAPEVLCKSYDEKCDIWSVGVILYMMICYRPPFNGDTETEVMENILKQQASFTGVYFKNTSQECLDLLKKMLIKNPEHRPSALQAYQHPWIQRHLKISKLSHEGAIENLSTFKFDNRLEAVVFTYIVSQILTTQEKETLKELFEILDKNHDGVISIEELKQALLSRKEISEERIDFLMRVIDTNNSGEIDFTEFIVAALQPERYNQAHFQQAFAYFDIDHSGYITYDQIASFLENKQHSEEEIRNIFRELDENHDGQISKDQFLKVLLQKNKERLDRQRIKTRKLMKTSGLKEKRSS